ncbi:MAG: serine/threonine protein phosphatase [Crenarchaeota archaeon]|nr:serine/threonine protein phosphatase [Thermoproteota archaeon]
MLEEVPVESYEELIKFASSLSCEDLLKIVREGKDLLNPQPQELDAAGGVVFHGDIHGDVRTLYALWERVGLEKVLDKYKLVFLGDYVDRGPEQIEALLLVLALKARRPEEVVVLRGNHEPPRWLPVSPHDYPDVLYSRCGPLGDKIYEESLELFDKMPLIALVDDVVALHGGPPAKKVIEGCEGRSCVANLDRVSIEEVLWSDPDELMGPKVCSWSDPPEKCLDYNPRGAGVLWGAGLTREFLERLGAKYIVRGHTAVDGFALCHNSRVLTLFSRSGNPYYNTNAAVLLMKGKNFHVITVSSLDDWG